MGDGNAENDGVWEGTSPLETPELLEKVLSYVPPKDLINARAVAGLWRDESLDNFRKGIVYVLDPETESERLLKLTLGIEANDGIVPVQSTSAAVASPSPSLPMYRFQDKPMKKYRLAEPQELLPTGTDAFERNRYFWELCGPHVTSLDLNGGLVIRKTSFIDGIIWLLRTCPNLEELQFAPVCVPEDETAVFPARDEDVDEEIRNMSWEEVRYWYVHLYGPDVTFFIPPMPKKDLAKMKENLAPNVKSLSITIPEIPTTMDKVYVALTNSRIICNLWRCVLSLLPNLKSLSMDRLYYSLVMDALLRGMLTSNNQLIQLETFKCWSKSPDRNSVNFGFQPLLEYLEKLEKIEGSAFLKELRLMQIPLNCIWKCPKTFRNVLFRIRKDIQKFNFGLLHVNNNRIHTFCKLDLFNFVFPNLTELVLEFDCMPSGAGRGIGYFFDFDFSVFRGTPNLTRFRMEYLNVLDRTAAWKQRRLRLTSQCLMQYRNLDKWHRLPQVDQYENMEPIVGDGDETFDPWDGQTEIVLEKMEEFYFTRRFTKEALLVLGKWMKNLKEIAVIFDEETLSVPFVVWPETLKKLTVLGASFDEEGISQELISRLREMYPEVEIVVEEEETLGLDQLALDDDDDSVATYTTSDDEDDDEEW